MSKSIHTTYKDVRGLTKAEILEQAKEPNSDLSQLGKKSAIKRDVKSKRKQQNIERKKG